MLGRDLFNATSKVARPVPGSPIRLARGTRQLSKEGAAVEAARMDGKAVSNIQLRHLNPFPTNLEPILRRFNKILVPELNQGQLVRLLRSEFLVPAIGMNKVRGQPFLI